MLVIKEGLTREGILCEPSRVIKAIQRDVVPLDIPANIIPISGASFRKREQKRQHDFSTFHFFPQPKKSHEYKENHFYDTFLEEISLLAIGICMWRELFRFEIFLRFLRNFLIRILIRTSLVFR